MSARDNQRKRLYDAEFAVRSFGTGAGRRLETVPEVQAYVNAILGSRWFKARWGVRSIPVLDGRGRRSACAEGSRIKMPLWARNEMVTLHEVAHVLTPGKYADHGPEFAGVLLALIRQFMGPEAAASLRESFRGHRVKSNTAAVPSPRYRVESRTAREKAVRAVAARPPSPMRASEAAEAIRKAARNGWFGPAGSKPRQHALATARALEAR